MNSKKQLALVFALTLSSIFFIFASLFFITPLRVAVIKFLLAAPTAVSSREDISRNVAAAVTSFTGISRSVPSLSSSTSTAFSSTTALGSTTPVIPDAPLPRAFEYKLLRSVDSCTLNQLGSQGFQAIQFGGNIDTSTGREADCSRFKGVDVLDWVLFVREK